MKNKTLWIVLAIVAVVVIWGISSYNGLVNKQEGVATAWSNVETQYQRRADLIPNLVNTVKGYATHESSTLEKVTQALLAAYRRDHEDVGENLVIEADEANSRVRLFIKKEIVDEFGSFGD